MILTIDVGNSNIVIGCEEEGKILFIERLRTNHSATALEYAVSLKSVFELYGLNPMYLEGAIISSVVPSVTATIEEAVKKIAEIDVMVVGPGIKTGLSILIDNPAQLGSDLVVDAVAGINLYEPPLIIIDMGTATTISVIDKNKNYIGGMIMPGMKVSLDSMVGRTSQLPKISMDLPKRLIGSNTIDCMKSGLLYGVASSLDGMIDRIEAELGMKTTIIATGGLAPVVVPLCKNEIILDDALLLRGLIIIYKKNCSN